jgi:AcrR family transcriptional regulator
MTATRERVDTRTAILDAADRVLAEYGYKKTTMEDVASEARLGRRTIYLYFKTKEELALATIDRTIDLLLAQLREVMSAALSPAERIHAMLVRRIMFLFDRAQNTRHTMDDVYMALRPQYKAHRERYIQSEVELFAEVLRDGQRLGLFAFEDPVEVGNALVVATSSLTPFSLNVRELGERDQVERKIRLTADLLIYGLLHGEP